MKDKECDGKIYMKMDCCWINVGYVVGEGVKFFKDSDINVMFCVLLFEWIWYFYVEIESDVRYWMNVLDFYWWYVFYIFFDYVIFGDNLL